MEKLSDWHRFATEPKFIALCESMEQLALKEVSSKLHPDNLAQKIRKLQNEWKKLGVLHDETLWQRFKTAADQAFLPCSEFFTERDAIREDNLKKREPIVTKITELLNDTDWEQEPDYQNIESKLKQAHQQWQSIKNVAKAEGDKQWKRYSEIRNKVFDKLSIEYDRNHNSQKQLIKQSEKLLSTGIDQNSFEKLKYLQSSWKDIGITRTKDDRKAWRDFKKSNDAVYAAIKDLQRANEHKYDDMLSAHYKIIEQLNNLANQNEASDAKVESLEQDFHALASLPRDFPEAKLIGVDKSFKRAQEKYRKSRERQRQTVQRQQATLLHKKASLCKELELAHSSAQTNQDLIEDLCAQFNDSEVSDKSIETRLANRMQAAAQQDRDKFNEERRRLCIQIEILSNIESPTEDRALRTQMQLETMSNKGLGANVQAQTLENLKIDWLCLPGAVPNLQNKFDDRLQKLFNTNA